MFRVYVNHEWLATFDNILDAQQCAANFQYASMTGEDDGYGQFPEVEVVEVDD